MSARAVPCEVPAIKRNIVSGCKEPTESYARANREGISQKSRCGKRGPCEERLRSHLLEARCRGRDDHRWSPPAQIRTSALTHTALTVDG